MIRSLLILVLFLSFIIVSVSGISMAHIDDCTPEDPFAVCVNDCADDLQDCIEPSIEPSRDPRWGRGVVLQCVSEHYSCMDSCESNR